MIKSNRSQSYKLGLLPSSPPNNNNTTPPGTPISSPGTPISSSASTPISPNTNPNETLLSAVKRHDVELVKTTVTRLNADVNYLPPQPPSSSLLRLVRKATEEGGGQKRKWPPLLEAIGHNYADLVEVLLLLGADGKGIDAKGNSAIHVGSAEGRRDIVRRLLEEKGVEVEGVNEFGQTALHLAAGRRNGGGELVKELLLAGGEGGGKQCGGGLSPLHEACKSDNVEAALLILVAGGNIEQKDDNGATPLYYAVAHGSLQCYDLLITHGAKVDVVTNEGDTLLHASIAKNHTAITIRLLARDHAPFDSPNKEKMTPLHLAASWGRSSCASLLITKGANLDAQTQLGNTALHLAVLRLGIVQQNEIDENKNLTSEEENKGDKCMPLRTIEVLLAKGSSWKKRNNDKYTPIHFASLVGGPKALQILLTHAHKSSRGTFNRFNTTTSKQISSTKKEGEDGESERGEGKVGLVKTGVSWSFGKEEGKSPAVSKKSDDSTKSDTDPPHSQNNSSSSASSLRSLPSPIISSDVLASELHCDGASKDTPLHLAVISGDTRVLELILPVIERKKKSCSGILDTYDEGGNTAMSLAAALGNFKAIELLLDWGANPNKKTSKGDAPLHLSFSVPSPPHTECARALLQGGAEVDIFDDRGDTSLHVGCETGCWEGVPILVDAGASLTAVNHLGFCPIEVACWFGREEVVRSLLQSYPSIPPSSSTFSSSFSSFSPPSSPLLSSPPHNSFSSSLPSTSSASPTSALPLHHAAFRGHTTCLSILLDSNHFPINQSDPMGRTPLHLACASGERDCAQLLVNKGADLNIEINGCGGTPAGLAARYGNLESLAMLHTHGVGHGMLTGTNLLHLASGGGGVSVVSYLLETRVSGVDSEDGEGWTALHHAAFNGHTKCIEILLAAGCDPAKKNKRADTPLHLAISKGTTHIAKLLLDRTPSLAHLPNKQNLCPLQIAVIYKQFECLDVLYKIHPPSDPLLCGDRENILHTAARFGSVEAFPLLVHLGNDPLSLTEMNFTIFHSAAKANQGAFLESLLSGSNAANVGGLDPNSADKRGRTALHVATISRAGKAVQVLLNHQVTAARMDEVDDDGLSPLLYALTPYKVVGANGEETIVAPDLRCCLLLLGKGCSLLHRNLEGDTPLHLAVQAAFCLLGGQQIKKTTALLHSPRGRKGSASLFHSLPSNNILQDLTKLFKLLLEHPECDPNAVNSSGQTPLHLLAAFSGESHIWAKGEVPQLLMGRCNGWVKDLEGKTPGAVADGVGGRWFREKLRDTDFK